ncbi:MAG TPA: L,D-transpeptidase [Vicinamibacterales bacterium]|nr:L,D-transpeptidase [Vicinamibacterales bacterium]
MTIPSMLLVMTLAAQATTPARPTPRTPPPAPADQAIIAVQVALDRAGFSPGVIDGKTGANTQRAAAAYREQQGADIAPAGEPLLQYQITSEDTAGPFTDVIPDDLVEQSTLPSLSYRSAAEALGERFHTTADVLKRLNPSATFAAGETIAVPNVEPFELPAPSATTAPGPVAAKGSTTAGRNRPAGTSGVTDTPTVVVRVSKSASALTVTGQDGKIVFFAPVTTGSEKDPLPIGEWKVNGVQYNPTFRYNPALFWDADPSHTKANIPPGPNGPVGVAWIDISKEHYGLHGTPEPTQIGRTESHGCVRLTNWDVLRLAKLVRPGTQVIFTE